MTTSIKQQRYNTSDKADTVETALKKTVKYNINDGGKVHFYLSMFISLTKQLLNLISDKHTNYLYTLLTSRILGNYK